MPEKIDKTVQLDTGAFDKTIQLKPGEIRKPAPKKARSQTRGAGLSAKLKSINPLNTGVFTRKRDIDDEISKTSSIEMSFTESEIKLDGVDGLKRSLAGHLEERFEIVEEFAEGGHGLISMARDKELQRLVALKSIKPDFANDQRILESFVSEARLTSQLEHPSVVPIYSMERDSCESVHLAMKLIRGRTLKEYLAQIVKSYNRESVWAYDERKSLSFRLDIFLRVCDALSYAHSRNVMHCDLKPENIMIGEYRETYLMDWGIARLINEPGFDPTKWVKPKSIAGTPKYLSPEAINGEHTDQRADIYAMGLILFEIATLSNAVAGSDPMEVMTKIRSGDLEPLRHRFGYHIDGDLKAIIRKALETDRDRRYAKVSDLAEDIRRYLRYAEVSANPDSLPVKCVRWLYNHRIAFASLLAAALLVGAFGVAFALYERMSAIEVARERESATNRAHSMTMETATGIDRLALHLENSLGTLASEAVFLIRWEHAAKAERYYDYAELTNPATAPSDLSYSPVYKMMLSPRHFVYKAPPGMSKEEAANDLRKPAPLGKKMPFLLMESMPGTNVGPSQIEAARKALLEKAYPMRWIYIGLEDGFYMSYPGKGSYPASFDPRLRPWYKEGSKRETVSWSSPYVDSGGQGIVLPCTAPIMDEENNRYGVAGMDIAFDYIIDALKQTGNRGDAVIDKFLVNKAGRIVVSTNSSFIGLTYKPGMIVNDVPVLPEFPNPNLLKRMWHDQFGTILERGIESETLYSFATINTLSLLYIEQIDFDKLRESAQEAKKSPAPKKQLN